MTPQLTAKQRKAILERDDYTCQRCGHKGESGYRLDCVQVHHIVRRADGGTNEPANLVTLCGTCHKKSDRETWVNAMSAWQRKYGYKKITQDRVTP